MADKVLFHSLDGVEHCPDGFAAAYCAWRCLGAEASYIPCVYGQVPPIVDAGDCVFLVDFSFPRDVLLAWNDIAHVVVLDHHKTAQAALEGLRFARFDMNRSGAQMAWDYFCAVPESAETRPAMVEYVADRDLWRKQLPHTEEIHRALATFRQDFEVWDTLARLPRYVNFMRRIGEPLLQKHRQDVRELADSAEWRGCLGFRVLSTNTNRYSLVSDALNLVCREQSDTDFAFNFWEQDGVTKYELRSVGDFDVSAIAKHFGGGGHKNAAGCSISVSGGGHKNT